MELNKFIDELFKRGKEEGFSDMEVYYIDSDSFEVNIYNQEVDKYNVNKNKGLSLRAIYEGRIGYAYTEKFDEEDIEFLIKNAKNNALETQTDVIPEFYSGGQYRELEMDINVDIDTKKKIEDAMYMERRAKEYDSRIDSVNYCLIDTGKGRRKIVNTRGLNLEEESGVSVAYIAVVAKDKDDVKSGSSFKVTSNYNNIDFEKLVKEACDEAINSLGAESIPSGKYKVILRRDAAATLLATFSSIFSGDAVQKGFSLLKGKIGKKIASDKITILDDPFLKDAPSSCFFDDEGVETYTKEVIKDGVLKTYLYDIKSAKKDGVKSTGNGFKASYKSPVVVSPTNMYIVKGTLDYEEAIKRQERAIIITSLQGLHSGANPVSGDFSLAAEGYLVENGSITKPVEQITIAGNFYKLLEDVEEVLSDFELALPSGMGSYGSPSIIIKELNVSGK
ncbi:TldD/PmbA family protein [Thermobrachium celere]|uniref:TldE protein, part of TldE/TldD proteolytic complex n=1 Tax=Thermobrachium celere DSM 8682 TaxID=941824 RepID=R7RQG0_9CLOT|nr:TldD/PmbA family protein [Thermobrachium celere]CDF57566.1 TldE protein, part of TldE/TldD proteolytic complex [Thermobrachium celere DSM 8682]